jgi:hypothetical protein
LHRELAQQRLPSSRVRRTRYRTRRRIRIRLTLQVVDKAASAFVSHNGDNSNGDGLKVVASALSMARDVVVLAAVYLYFAGFMYKYYYFDSFHIKSALDAVSSYVAFVYSYTVFLENLVELIIVAILIVAVVAVIMARTKSQPETRKVAIGSAAIIFALVAFPVINRWSWKAAAADAEDTRRAAALGNDTALTLVDEKRKFYGADFLNAASGEGLHILAKSDKYTYFLQQPPNGSKAFAKVTIVPNDEIGSVYVDQNQ